MAIEGSLSSSDYKGRYIRFSWSASQDIAKNQSTISWSLVGDGSSSNSWYYAGNFTVVIDGDEEYFSDSRIKLYDGTSITSGTKTIKHNSDGKRSFSVSIKAGIYEYKVNCTGSTTFTLTQIPRAATISSAPNFTDEGNPTLNYSNAAGSTVSSLQACIASSDGETIYVPYRDISKTGTSYTFSLTDAERETLRKACVNSKTMTVKFYVKTVISGTTYRNSLGKTLTITNANPTFNPVITPASTSVDITGSEDIVIRYFSEIKYIFNATAKKHATIKSYSITCGNLKGTSASGALYNIPSGEFVMTVTDSRGYTATQTLSKRIVNYVKPTCVANYESPLADGSVRLLLDGNYYKGSLGATPNVLLLQYRYREQGGEWSAWQTAEATYGSNKYSADIQVTGLNYRKVCELQAQATDIFETAVSNIVVVKFLPIFEWGEIDFNFNVPIFITDRETENVIDVVSDIETLKKAIKAMTTAYKLDTTIELGDNYSSGSASCYLIGNSLRFYFNVVRESASSTGNITNEVVATVTTKHGGKVKSIYNISFINGSTGSVASFTTGNEAYDDEELSFDISLTAVASSASEWSGYFAMMVPIDLEAY